jgi:hypothetical protein
MTTRLTWLAQVIILLMFRCRSRCFLFSSRIGEYAWLVAVCQS